MKGLGYAIESMMAIVIILGFALGAVQVSSPDQDWSDYQRHIAAQDITYSMQSSGKLENFIERGEMGSFQDTATTISERDMEVSGAVSNLPLYELSVGYFTIPENRFDDENIVEAGETCDDDDLSELYESVDDGEVYRTDGGLEDEYETRLYLANTNPTGLEFDTTGYDTLWVDNGTECQFADEDGPFHLNDIFYWGDDENNSPGDHFDFKNADAGSGDAVFYNATQAKNIKTTLKEGVNEINTEVSLNVVDFNEIESESHQILIFSERESLDIIDSNRDTVESHMVDGSMLLLMNPEQGDMTTDIISSLNFEWIDASYEDNNYDGGSTDAIFSQERDSINLETLYRAQDSDEADLNDLQLRPPGKIVSNSSSRIESGRTLYSPSQIYDFSEWSFTEDNMNYEGSHTDDPGDCDDVYSGTANLEGSDVDFINAAVGSSCDNYALVFDFEGDGNYDSEVHLNGERVKQNNIEYAIDLYSCGNEGECATFYAIGQDNVELFPNTRTFDWVSGEARVGMLGYQDSYNEEQTKLISSVIHWLTEGDHTFEGLEDPSEVDTSAKGSVYNEVYMPYKINLRWSE